MITSTHSQSQSPQSPSPHKLSRSPSLHDPEQQLRSLFSLIEQYNQHYSQMLQKHKETLRDTVQFQDFIGKVKMRSQGEVQSLYEGMKSVRKMLEDVLARSMAVLPEAVREFGEARGRMQQVIEQLDDKQLVIQGLRENKSQVEKHLAEITMMYDKSRYEYLELSEKINLKEQEFQTQSREIRKTFMEVTESNEQEKKMLQEMYENNQKLATALHEIKTQKHILQKQLQKSSQDLLRQKLKIHNLESQLDKKQQKLKQYESQLESIHMSKRKPSKNSMSSNNNNSEEETYVRESFNQQFQERKLDKTRLNQELVNYQMPSVKELNGSFIMGSGIKRSVGQQSDYDYEQKPKQKPEQQQPKPEPKKPKDISDPYFSHYILISQSVKIKQDCQDMLNIDMKPYYQEIIEKRIPMHLWDQWVKNRLRELLRQNYMGE